RAYSLPGQDPAVNLNFDRAVQVCANKGTGFHLITNAEWAAIALWCRKNSCMPNGNNYYGKDSTESTYVAIPASRETSGDNIGRVNRVLTGTGPVSWSHNGDRSGIWDLNGNVYEWVGGYRTVAGEIQILANNNAADSSLSQSSNSAQWKAILEDGTLVAPATANTLKWDYKAEPGTINAGKEFELAKSIAYRQSNGEPYGVQAFELLTTRTGVTVPELLKALALMPDGANSHGGDSFYMRNAANDERLLHRGGNWGDGASGGVFYGIGNGERGDAGSYLGFRSAYVKLPSAS
ncbi:MAG: SUMF1/EgtB/PvdO family nonheme iron enzyme, partial [Clostridia bacterium]